MAQPFKISLNNFRAFATTGQISIRPLTLLVGENSTGKSSFLSALRFAFDLNNVESESYFNSYPFDLGSFEDILHDAPSGGSPDKFSVSIEKSIDTNREAIFRVKEDEKGNISNAKMKFFFESNFGDVAISSIELKLKEGHLNFQFSKAGEVSIISEGEIITLSGLQGDLFNGPAEKRYINIRSALYFLMTFRFGREHPDWTPRQKKIGRII